MTYDTCFSLKFLQITLSPSSWGLLLIGIVARFREGQNDTLLWASVLDKDTRKNLWSFLGKNKFIKERTKTTLQGKGGPDQEKHWCWNDKVRRVFKTGLYIHLGRRGLAVLIDSCKLHNSRLYCTYISHNSVCYNQMYVCIEYLWTLNRLQLPEVTWGHSCASRASV